jgi:hypothetical protein
MKEALKAMVDGSPMGDELAAACEPAPEPGSALDTAKTAEQRTL